MENHKKVRHTSSTSSANRTRPNLASPAKAMPRGFTVGLDILEYLAKCSSPPTLSAISAGVSASVSTVFRSLAVLEQRGYVTRTGKTGAYERTDRLCLLQSTAPAHQQLLAHARPVMHTLSTGISQSCNLAILSLPDMQVVAQQESPGPCGINVPLGFRYDIPASAPGLAFAAFTKNADPSRWPTAVSTVVEAQQWSTLKKAIQRAAEVGFAQVENPYMPDVIDLSCPIIVMGQFVAALTVPYIKAAGSANLAWSLAALQQAAEQLSESLHGDALVA